MEEGYTGWVVAAFIFAVAQWGSFFDDNKKPVYGEELGLPVNCRAYVQRSIDGYRTKKFSAEEAMDGLERNCGLNGNIWKDKRNQ